MISEGHVKLVAYMIIYIVAYTVAYTIFNSDILIESFHSNSKHILFYVNLTKSPTSHLKSKCSANTVVSVNPFFRRRMSPYSFQTTRKESSFWNLFHLIRLRLLLSIFEKESLKLKTNKLWKWKGKKEELIAVIFSLIFDVPSPKSPSKTTKSLSPVA